ncbi:MAG: hypothetical protein MPJ25_16300, partial [Pirellulales bacterium]|nr:hypothetical protein [Pirellulales bacterium]
LNPNRNNIYRKQDFTKRRRSLRKFLRELLKWEDYIKSLTNYERQVLECHYKNFFFYTKKGYTPLPRNLMRNWYEYYYLIIPILTCHGHLRLEKGYFNPFEAKEYHSEIIGNCNYFSVLF